MTAPAILELWEQARPTVEARLVLLEAAARAEVAGCLESRLRQDALGAAHKLAGSLGTYGVARGSELAGQIERELETGADANRLPSLVAELRRVTGRAMAG